MTPFPSSPATHVATGALDAIEAESVSPSPSPSPSLSSGQNNRTSDDDHGEDEDDNITNDYSSMARRVERGEEESQSHENSTHNLPTSPIALTPMTSNSAVPHPSPPPPHTALSSSSAIATPSSTSSFFTLLMRVASELSSTEKSYVSSIRILLHHFITPLVLDPKLQLALNLTPHAQQVFAAAWGALTPIVKLHEEVDYDIAEALSAHVTSSAALIVAVSNIFLRHSPYFKLYTAFVDVHSACLTLLASPSLTLLTSEKKRWVRWLEEQQRQYGGGQNLQSLMIQLIQRPPRFELLLNKLDEVFQKKLKHQHIAEMSMSEESSIALALLTQARDSIQSLNLRLNEWQRASESKQRLWSLNNIIKGLPVGYNILESHRRYISDVQVIQVWPNPTARKSLQLWLTTDVLILVSSEKCKLKGWMELSDITAMKHFAEADLDLPTYLNNVPSVETCLTIEANTNTAAGGGNNFTMSANVNSTSANTNANGGAAKSKTFVPQSTKKFSARLSLTFSFNQHSSSSTHSSPAPSPSHTPSHASTLSMFGGSSMMTPSSSSSSASTLLSPIQPSPSSASSSVLSPAASPVHSAPITSTVCFEFGDTATKTRWASLIQSALDNLHATQRDATTGCLAKTAPASTSRSSLLPNAVSALPLVQSIAGTKHALTTPTVGASEQGPDADAYAEPERATKRPRLSLEADNEDDEDRRLMHTPMTAAPTPSTAIVSRREETRRDISPVKMVMEEEDEEALEIDSVKPTSNNEESAMMEGVEHEVHAPLSATTIAAIATIEKIDAPFVPCETTADLTAIDIVTEAQLAPTSDDDDDENVAYHTASSFLSTASAATSSSFRVDHSSSSGVDFHQLESELDACANRQSLSGIAEESESDLSLSSRAGSKRSSRGSDCDISTATTTTTSEREVELDLDRSTSSPVSASVSEAVTRDTSRLELDISCDEKDTSTSEVNRSVSLIENEIDDIDAEKFDSTGAYHQSIPLDESNLTAASVDQAEEDKEEEEEVLQLSEPFSRPLIELEQAHVSSPARLEVLMKEEEVVIVLVDDKENIEESPHNNECDMIVEKKNAIDQADDLASPVKDYENMTDLDAKLFESLPTPLVPLIPLAATASMSTIPPIVLEEHDVDSSTMGSMEEEEATLPPMAVMTSCEMLLGNFEAKEATPTAESSNDFVATHENEDDMDESVKPQSTGMTANESPSTVTSIFNVAPLTKPVSSAHVPTKPSVPRLALSSVSSSSSSRMRSSVAPMSDASSLRRKTAASFMAPTVSSTSSTRSSTSMTRGASAMMGAATACVTATLAQVGTPRLPTSSTSSSTVGVSGPSYAAPTKSSVARATSTSVQHAMAMNKIDRVTGFGSGPNNLNVTGVNHASATPRPGPSHPRHTKAIASKQNKLDASLRSSTTSTPMSIVPPSEHVFVPVKLVDLMTPTAAVVSPSPAGSMVSGATSAIDSSFLRPLNLSPQFNLPSPSTVGGSKLSSSAAVGVPSLKQVHHERRSSMILTMTPATSTAAGKENAE